jgi:chromatin remodeling complex protein RSC6
MSANISSDSSIKMSATKGSKKAATTATATATATAPAVAAAAPAAPVATKAPKASKAVPAVAAPVVAAPVVAAPAVTAPAAEEDLGATLAKSIADLHEQLSSLKAAASTAAAALKGIEKQAAKLAKKADRRRKRSTKNADGSPATISVFQRPSKITDELCVFLGKPKGTQVPRSEVTKAMVAYAKAHNLMDKQTIKADAALRKLLSLKESDELTILTLQKYLKPHYVKA